MVGATTRLTVHDLLALADQAEAVSPCRAQALRDGVTAYLEGEPLELALFGPYAGRSPRARHLETVRNDALFRASYHIDAQRLTPRAKRLASEVRRFAGHKWLCWRDKTEPPARATPIERELHDAFRAGDVPETWRALFEILKRYE